MDHVCKLDIRSDEYNKLINGSKTMIIRGANRKTIPFERVFSGDVIYFIGDNNYEKIVLKANVLDVLNFSEMSREESKILVNKYQFKLQLTVHQYNKWAGKKYIVLIEVNNVEMIEPFSLDRKGYRLVNKWILVGNIRCKKESQVR